MRDIQQQSTDRQMHFTHSRLTGQFGETNIVYEKEYNDYDFIAEGDSSSIIGLYSCGLRGFENGAFGSYGGRYSYYTASGEDAGYPSTLSGGVVPGQYVNE